jgi:hypothetical protein
MGIVGQLQYPVRSFGEVGSNMAGAQIDQRDLASLGVWIAAQLK